MLAALLIAVLMSIVYASAELAYRIVRLSQTPPRWRAWALLVVSLAGFAGLVHLIESML